jgi:hypothetical protein
MQAALMTSFFLGVTVSASADTFQVSVDTSQVRGSQPIGGIYFQFSPGLDPSSVSIDSFQISPPGGLIDDPAPGTDQPPGGFGDVTGSLNPLPLLFGNNNATASYLQYLNFGDSITFTFTFNLPATITQNPSFTPASFGFEITDSGGLFSVFPVDNNLLNVEMTYDSTGNIFFSTPPTTDAITVASAVPEPRSIFLVATVMGLVGFRKKLGSVLR